MTGRVLRKIIVRSGDGFLVDLQGPRMSSDPVEALRMDLPSADLACQVLRSLGFEGEPVALWWVPCCPEVQSTP